MSFISPQNTGYKHCSSWDIQAATASWLVDSQVRRKEICTLKKGHSVDVFLMGLGKEIPVVILHPALSSHTNSAALDAFSSSQSLHPAQAVCFCCLGLFQRPPAIPCGCQRLLQEVPGLTSTKGI